MSDLWQRGRWVLAAALVAGAGAFLLARIGGRAQDLHPLDIAPAAARIVARIDVGTVMRSHLWRVILEEDEGGGTRRIERVCGYDPLDGVEDAVVFVFGSDEHPFEHVGFVAFGEMARGNDNRERLLDCVRSVIHQEGGAIQEVEIEGEPAVASAHGRSYAAFFGDDGVVGGDREVVQRTFRVSRGEAPAARTDPTLSHLWERVSHDRDIVVVARLPERWIPALRRMARGMEDELDALARVRAFGVGVRVRNGLSIGAAIQTGSDRDAEDIERAIHQRVDTVLAEPVARLSVVGSVLRRLDVQAQEADVVITLSLRNEQVDDLLEVWRELQARERDREGEAGDGGPREDGGVPDAETDRVEAEEGGPEARREP